MSVLNMFRKKYESSRNEHSFGIKADTSKAESFLLVGKYFHVFYTHISTITFAKAICSSSFYIIC